MCLNNTFSNKIFPWCYSSLYTRLISMKVILFHQLLFQLIVKVIQNISNTNQMSFTNAFRSIFKLKLSKISPDGDLKLFIETFYWNFFLKLFYNQIWRISPLRKIFFDSGNLGNWKIIMLIVLIYFLKLWKILQMRV
jgi:hypothetical protein